MKDRITGRFLPSNPIVRFWSKVDKRGETDCWVWLGGTSRSGYGYFYFTSVKRVVSAHRFAYELIVGKIPPDMTIDHLCRNRSCVNPAHMEVVTRGENVLRGTGITAKNLLKTHCPKGHPYSLENTYVMGKRRVCRTCHREKQRIRQGYIGSKSY